MHRTNRNQVRSGVWSVSEHERFIEAMSLYPRGPWRLITEHVGSRSIKQVQTHAQKYQQKLMRHQRGLRKRKTKLKRPEHRVDETTLDQFTHGCIVRYAQKLAASGGDASLDHDSGCHSPATSSSASSTPERCVVNLAGVSTDEWALMTKDTSKDSEFMTLLDDVDPVEFDFDPEFGPGEWNEWQFEELLQPVKSMEIADHMPLDGSQLPSASRRTQTLAPTQRDERSDRYELEPALKGRTHAPLLVLSCKQIAALSPYVRVRDCLPPAPPHFGEPPRRETVQPACSRLPSSVDGGDQTPPRDAEPRGLESSLSIVDLELLYKRAPPPTERSRERLARHDRSDSRSTAAGLHEMLPSPQSAAQDVMTMRLHCVTSLKVASLLALRACPPSTHGVALPRDRERATGSTPRPSL
ncbi:hypothetical protein P43SY_007408 [Pythium insidiosum]|uniref:Myb-like DNA-binding protein n=1 Tax=Pythium insidiosum TaxID=114742 RepID=A0AAD5LEZ5_PYTIN|nr:hypothetical protein P43SY_007408 [Pythium insidiosum]